MRTGLCLSAAFFSATFATAAVRPLPAQIGLSTGAPCYEIGALQHLLLFRPGAYTVTVRSTYEQRLADGNVIRGSSEATRARDSQGRTMDQSTRGCERAEDGTAGERTQVSVSDTKARTSLTWILGPRSTHVAFLRHNPDIRTDFHPVRPPQLETMPRHTSARNEQTSEQLGTRTIAGLQATGVRFTRIVPAGTEGNDLPIRVLRETWSSQNPRAELMVVEDDPRFGHVVWEVTALSLAEPDPSVFAPPPGYTVDEGKPFEPRGTAVSLGSSSTTTGTSTSVTPPR